MNTELTNKIFSIKTDNDFHETALQVFRFQAKYNTVYSQFISKLNIDPNLVKSINEIPFLPIEFFKTHKIVSSDETEKALFYSSGTTGQITSKHYVLDTDIYIRSFINGFEKFYGAISDYMILGLLPSYLDRSGSSLVFMVQEFIKRSKYSQSGFYLNNYSELTKHIIDADNSKKKVLLIGVSYALLDLIEENKFTLKSTIIMETGGMKGRRKEMVKEELHNILKSGFCVSEIHSEYGMTELLSQAYSKGNGIFKTPNWMKIMIRDIYDPFSYQKTEKSGGINIIDLANIYSCSFIETRDLGKLHNNKTFEVLGRFDNSDIRGCNLMVE